MTEGHFLDHPRFEPVLAGAEALGVPIYLHPWIPDAQVRAADRAKIAHGNADRLLRPGGPAGG